MLAPDRFQFETPNAIDAGEAPPSRPTRGLSSSSFGSSSTGRVSSEKTRSPFRKKRTEKFRIDGEDDDSDIEDGENDGLMKISNKHDQRVSQTIKIQIRNNDDDVDEAKDGSGDEDRKPQHNQLLSIEEARLYAAAVLSESSRSESFRMVNQPLNGSGSDSHRRRRRHTRGGLRTMKHRPCDKWDPLPWFGLIALFGFVFLFFLRPRSDNGVYVGLHSGIISDDTITFLSEISSVEDLLTEGTPQFLAARWISNVDQLHYEIPSSDNDAPSSHRFVQRYVLAVLFFALGGEGWHEDLEFLSNEDECAWYNTVRVADGQQYAHGVTCGGLGLHVRDIYIPSNNLVGSIPSEILHLPKLEMLSLSSNHLTGYIPDAVSSPPELRYLDLGHNALTGTLPSKFDSLTELRVLSVGGNSLFGTLPSSWISLTNMRTLSLENNAFMGKLSDVVGKLTKLEFLYVGNNLFKEGVTGKFLVDLGQLRELDLQGNAFDGDLDSNAFFVHPYLSVVDLSRNNFEGRFPENVYSNPNSPLKHLALDENVLVGTIPLEVQNLVQLTSLGLSHNQFTGTIPPSIGNLNKLEYISMGENRFSHQLIPGTLYTLENLHELSLPNTQLTGPLPSQIGLMTNIRFLDLRSNELSGIIPTQMWNLPDLSFLLLDDNHLNGNSPPIDVVSIGNLEVLSLHKNSLTGGDLDGFCSQASELHILTYDCDQFECSSDCCHACCTKSDSGKCFDDTIALVLPSAEQLNKYNKSDYGLSPNIIIGV